MEIRIIETDVLSIGGSGAGIMSAVYAAENGAKVCLVSKGKVGYSGNLIMCGGGFGIDGESGAELGIEGCNTEFTKEKMFDAMVKESFYLSDQDMVQQYIDEGPEAVERFLSWAKESKQTFLFFPPANWITSGLSMAKTVAYGLAQTKNIEVYEDVMIVDVLKEDGRVCGAIGINIYTGEIICFHAKAVIIGTGGFQPFSMKNTVSDMTGDGPAMALRAGATVSDMEFILAFPTAVVPKTMKGSIYPFIMEYNMRNLNFSIKDKNGDEVIIPDPVVKMSRGGKLSKLVTSYYFGKAERAGLTGPNGGLFYDYSQNSTKEIQKGFDTLYQRFDNWHRHGFYKGESLAEIEKAMYAGEMLEVGMGFEYCMGGIEVNPQMETSIAGLYAAGETTSGVFGACRVGDGVVEMLSQGMRAGKEAAKYCAKRTKPRFNHQQAETLTQKYLSYLEGEPKRSTIDHYREIERICDAGFGLLRTQQDMSVALARLEKLLQIQPTLRTKEKNRSYNREWFTAIQAENLLLCCIASVKAGLERKESRGCHLRQDYETVNHDEFITKFVARLENGNISLSQRSPRVTKMPLPTGSKPNVIEYFLDPELRYKR